MNGRPLSMRKKIQILTALTILAWATQTLLHQWARGADLPMVVADPAGANLPASIDTGTDDTVPSPTREPRLPKAASAAEHFVPGPQRYGPGSTLELRSEATIFGPEVRLKQICRWSVADAAMFVPVADLIVARLDEKTPYRSVSLEELQSLMRDARVNLSTIKFAGPLLCTVHRSDAPVDQKDALDKWIDAREGAGARKDEAHAALAPLPPASATESAAVPAAAKLVAPAVAATGKGTAPALASVPPADPPATRPLRQAITEDLAIRLGIPVEQLQLTFNPKDDRALNLCEPQFRFNLEPVRTRNLGEVSWDVLVVHAGGTQKVSISATARAWQSQLVLNKPLAARQIIRTEDLTERRVLVDRLSDEPLLTSAQAVGQEASRDLKPMMVLSSRMVESVPLVKAGQFVTITVNQGGIRLKTVGRAMETGSFGQSIRVKNETTNDVFQVALTGPQEGVIGGQ